MKKIKNYLLRKLGLVTVKRARLICREINVHQAKHVANLAIEDFGVIRNPNLEKEFSDFSDDLFDRVIKTDNDNFMIV